MYKYKCRALLCGEIMVFDHVIKDSDNEVCKKCNKPLRKNDLYIDPNPYKHAKFAQDRRKKRENAVQAVRNRSSSAPPQVEADKLPAFPPNGVTYLAAINGSPWTDKTKIRLAYDALVSNTTGLQGIVIDPDFTMTAPLKDHYDAIASQMFVNHKVADATEATGEAATARAIAKAYPSYRMLWGFHCHTGAGIDQIWGCPDQVKDGEYTDYLIAEAKGPGQILSTDNTTPGNVGDQMSKDWVIDRLARMSDPLGAEILSKIGVTTHIKWANWNMSSKNYYGVQSHDSTKQTATLHGIVITAKWIPGPKLSHSSSNSTQYF